MPRTSYVTVAHDGEAEIEVERSRFRGLVARAEDETTARGVVEQQRRAHWDADHHCAAFVLGPEGLLAQSSDDGEPPGTCGAPMLEVLRGRGLSDVVAVVTRWFGGRLLGTGALGRAYAAATRAAVEDAGIVERVLHDVCEVEVDIAAVGRLEHDLRSRGARVLGVDYTGEAALRFAVPPQARTATEEIIAELTHGETRLRVVGQEWVDAGAPG